MVTVNRTEKPKILTESDYFLNDLKDELAGLKSRMTVIEEEQEKNRVLLNQLSIQEDLTDELIKNQQTDTEIHRENYHVIATVMRDLKSPVSSVVDNLAGILSNIDDSETRQTLRQCMDTASDVVHSFNEVADFCLDAGDSQIPSQQTVQLQELIKDIVQEFQNDDAAKQLNSLRVQIDSQTPETCPVYTETVRNCIKNLLDELVHVAEEADITIRVSVDNHEMKYGIQISDLTFHVELSETSGFSWGDTWFEGIRINRDKLLNFGLNLLKTRETLRKCGGQLEIAKQGQRLSGFKFFIPLTY